MAAAGRERPRQSCGSFSFRPARRARQGKHNDSRKDQGYNQVGAAAQVRGQLPSGKGIAQHFPRHGAHEALRPLFQNFHFLESFPSRLKLA